MIFGAPSNSSALHQAPADAMSNAGTSAKVALRGRHRGDYAGRAPICGTNGTVKPK